ncbi:hypothetical protein [Sphingobacterium paucimobilis]|uniref:Transposase n=1 Tax=Sphingobacterium paucimobilis HER1398 TaxID=1346330 RepID=U2HRU8_9SPHI|nr:hypothetical protein [Sphingobacterium paucimobilis]ERJ58005.1 hypothetical protein M472_04430 [Sphingobacterium paucimobilis HER1398]
MKYDKHTKEAAVRDIMEGRLLIGEVMVKYGVLSQATIKKWMRASIAKEKMNESCE